MIELLRLTIHNFSVWRDVTLELHQQGFVCVRGANGSGKTSLFRALHWVLYGKTAEGLKVAELTLNRDPTWVQLLFRTNGQVYRLTRYRNHHDFGNKLQLEGKYVPVSDEDSLVADVQAHLTRLLVVDSSMFLSSVYLAQRQFHYFHTLPDQGKKAFLERLTYGSLFRSCEEHARSRARVLEGEVAQIAGEVRGLTYSLEQLHEQQRIQSTTSLVSLEKCQRVFTQCSVAMQEHEGQIARLRQQLEQHYPLSHEYYNLTQDIQRFEQTIREIQDIQSCPTCYRTMTPQEREEVLSGFQGDIIAIQDRCAECRPSYDAVGVLESDIRRHEQEIVQLHTKSQLLTQRTQSIRSDYNGTKVIGELEDRLTHLQAELQDVQYELEHWKWWVTAFSFRGLRSLILGHAAQQVQDRTNHYLQRAGKDDIDPLRITFDANRLACTFGTRTYPSLSGGERQLVDLCTALAVRETAELYNKAKFNVLVLDEPFESADALSTARAQDVLHGAAKPSTFLITHQSLDADFDRVYECTKRHGVSSLRVVQ